MEKPTAEDRFRKALMEIELHCEGLVKAGKPPTGVGNFIQAVLNDQDTDLHEVLVADPVNHSALYVGRAKR